MPKLVVSEQIKTNIKPTFIKPVLTKEVNLEKVKEVDSLKNLNLPINLTPNYYLNSSTGYAVQIVGFGDMTLLSRFIKQYPKLEYFSYQRKLNGELFVVLTTKVFDSKEQARAELQLLPSAIIERGVWIKALSMIKTEITEQQSVI